MIRGVVFGFVLWIVGPLTLLPLLSGQSVQWSLEAGQAAYGGLVGHIIYGAILAFAYAFITRIHDILFIESDPIHRELEGPGTRSVRAIITGALASITGGLAFTVILVATDSLPTIGRLGGSESAVVGFVVHIIISAIIGSTYALFFGRVARSYGGALLWGLAYGTFWWFLGPLTLMPYWLTGDVAWSLQAAAASYPSLIGHLMYGAAMALTFHAVSVRYDPALQNPELLTYRAKDSTALWIAILLPSVLIPLMITM